MIVVISCAASKDPRAGRLETPDGRRVEFLAHPAEMPESQRKPDIVYVCPEETSGYGMPWRQKLDEYNQQYQRTGENPWCLLPASQLYTPREPYSNIYLKLVERFRADNVYILSAGWGLIGSSFLTPSYSVTFSGQNPVNRRRRKDVFRDFNHLTLHAGGTERPIVCIGGTGYVRQFCKLTEAFRWPKMVLHLGRQPSLPSDYTARRYMRDGHKHTWVYQCALDLIDGKLAIW